MTPYNEDDVGSTTDFLISSVKVSDGLKIIYSSLKNMEKTSWDITPKVNCENPRPWSGGKQLYAETLVDRFHRMVDWRERKDIIISILEGVDLHRPDLEIVLLAII